MSKVKKCYITDENEELLRELKERTGKSESALINDAIEAYVKPFHIPDDELLRIYKFFYNTPYAIGVRLNSRQAAKDSQTILEIINTLLHSNGKSYKFVSTKDDIHGLILSGKTYIEEKINRARKNRQLKG